MLARADGSKQWAYKGYALWTYDGDKKPGDMTGHDATDVIVSLNPKEVASVHRIPLAEIMRPDIVEFLTIPESNRRVIRVHINGSSIHAPTGALIYQFREVLAGRATRVNELEQPVFAWR